MTSAAIYVREHNGCKINQAGVDSSVSLGSSEEPRSPSALARTLSLSGAIHTCSVNFATVKLCSRFYVLSTCNLAFDTETLKPWSFETGVQGEVFGRFGFQRLRVDMTTVNISIADVRAERVPL